jgi:uncharacterized protein (DUF2126 family)/transglutaminase-like putative cysteine protease
MSVTVSIEHHTAYRFDRAVELGPHEVRLRPAPHTRTTVEAYTLNVTPAGYALTWRQDAFGNHVARVTYPKGGAATALDFEVGLVATLQAGNPFDFFVEPGAERWPFEYDAETRADLAPFLSGANGDPGSDPATAPLLHRRIELIGSEPVPTVELLVELNAALCDAVEYTTREEAGVQTPEETLRLNRGSCRDSAWLLVTMLRGLGIAARFTSGYLVQLGSSPDESDTVDLHAWAEAYIPGAGWIGMDPTSGLLTGEGHIPLAIAPRPSGAAPVIGSHSDASPTLTHTMSIARLQTPSDPERPYSDTAWQEILALGDTVDSALAEQDVRLTMGGEPTFVSRSQMDEPEWRVQALGGDKQALAIRLASKLAAEFAPDPLIMHTQGKWYPGEPIPRWQIGILWRTDRPLWPEQELLDTPAGEGERTPEDAERLIGALADALGLDPASDLLFAYETPAEDSDAGDAVEGSPVGDVLPLHREAGDARWSSPRWNAPDGRITLIPGDGPIGARLPLAVLTANPEDPDGETAPPTALCVEERNGHVHVYLPPLKEFAHSAELLEALRDVAAATSIAVVVEGYAPPRDDRLGRFVITPDPGVIEINIHPSSSWRELVERTEVIAREADALGLAAEKFDVAGRHLPTGGGSHLTLGGATPEDSPLLRRPALLRSMLTYWQHHPSLSYLFSGLFLGPTSQAPRIDEARHESLYELEIAFSEMDRLSELGPPPMWQVDRLLRNLLTDLTGNTHRAEFCIDKLYNPESVSGRLGVLELRGFEMSPHPQMSLVQALLVRALVARLWADPYRAPLVRWGNRLHDDFMLPWFLERDMALVLDDLQSHGFAFAEHWFEPASEFRFPRLGTVTRGGVTLELRDAIEPWNVLGEQAASSGTARYVDSSLQRVQIRADGFVEGRHALLCNGFTVPLSPTDTAGTAVAGIRFRASSPWSALHPTIPVHAPLTIELVDLHTGRSLGGCRYHVGDPGGAAPDRVPTNASEAAARRAARFEELGHTTGQIDVSPAWRSPEFPRTLDLRAAARRR